MVFALVTDHLQLKQDNLQIGSYGEWFGPNGGPHRRIFTNNCVPSKEKMDLRSQRPQAGFGSGS